MDRKTIIVATLAATLGGITGTAVTIALPAAAATTKVATTAVEFTYLTPKRGLFPCGFIGGNEYSGGYNYYVHEASYLLDDLSSPINIGGQPFTVCSAKFKAVK